MCWLVQLSAGRLLKELAAVGIVKVATTTGAGVTLLAQSTSTSQVSRET